MLWFSGSLILSCYLLQRAFLDLRMTTGSVLAWSREYQVSTFVLRFSYATMTLVWPVILAFLCLMFRMSILKGLSRSNYSSAIAPRPAAGERPSPADFDWATELATPATRLSWSLLSLAPATAMLAHFSSGVMSLALLARRPEVFVNDREVLAPDVGLIAFAMLLLACSFGLYHGWRFYRIMALWRAAIVSDLSSPASGFGVEAAPEALSKSNENTRIVESASGCWNIFISAKKLDSQGNITRDTIIARELYVFLQKQGHRVFFGDSSLEIMGASAYKEAIDRALESARVMIVVGTSAENICSTWVHYEWDSFVNEMLSGRKPGGRVFSFVEGVAVSELPIPLRQHQFFQNTPSDRDRLSRFLAHSPLDQSPTPEPGSNTPH